MPLRVSQINEVVFRPIELAGLMSFCSTIRFCCRLFLPKAQETEDVHSDIGEIDSSI